MALLAQGVQRHKWETAAGHRLVLLSAWILGSVAMSGIAAVLYALLNSAYVIWFMFSLGQGSFVPILLYGWSRFSVQNRDVQTGLLRRNAAEQKLSRIAATRSDVTLGLIDLNKLRDVNNAKGHGAGDEFIRTTARRLARLQNNKRTVARWGGDEFLIIAEGEPCHTLAEDIDAALHARHPLTNVWGLGQAGVCRSRTGETRVALECVDAALYRAKRAFYVGGLSQVLTYDSAKDGLPKYQQHIQPARPVIRRRDHHKKGGYA